MKLFSPIVKHLSTDFHCDFYTLFITGTTIHTYSSYYLQLKETLCKEQEIISKIKCNPNITEYETQLNLVFNTSYTFLILQAIHVSIMSTHWFIQWPLFFEHLIFPKDFFKSSNCKFALPYFLSRLPFLCIWVTIKISFSLYGTYLQHKYSILFTHFSIQSTFMYHPFIL